MPQLKDINLRHMEEKSLGQDGEAPIYWLFFISPGRKGKTISPPNFIPSLPEKCESPASLWSCCSLGQFGCWSNAGFYMGQSLGKHVLKAQCSIPNCCSC